MRSRILRSVIGIIVVGISVAGLLGVLDSLAAAEPVATGGIDTPSPSGPANIPDVSGNIPNPADLPFDISSGSGFTDVLPSLSISPQGGLPDHIPLFSVKGASDTSLLRSAVTSTFDGKTWKMADNAVKQAYDGETLNPNVTGFSGKKSSTVEVSPLSKFPSGTIPVPASQYVTSMDASVPLDYLPEDQLFISEDGLPEAYSFDAVEYSFPESTLNSAQIDPKQEYLQLSPTTTERTKDLAKQITKGIDSPYQKARAIEEYLKDNYSYDYGYRRAPAGQDPNDWFLFEEKQGVCSNFNSAFVTLARSAGIPSRLVSGYAIEPQAGEQKIFADQAHAWSEVKFKDQGWIPFDATGSQGALIPTETDIISVNPVVKKGHSFIIQGTVKANGTTVEGMLVELFINPQKSQTGGTKIGKGIVSEGSFDIEVTIPESSNVGNYQLLAHALDSTRFQGSWSDPRIKVTADTKISLTVAPRFKIKEQVNIQGVLTEDPARPISGQTVGLYLNGRPVVQATSGQKGQFQWSASFDTPGEYTIKAGFGGTEFLLQSNQETKFQVLTPTTLSLQLPETGKTGESITIEGYLLEAQSQKPVSGKTIELYIDNVNQDETGITDSNGRFRIQRSLDSDGIHALEVKFDSVPYYWESSAQGSLQILAAKGSKFWVIPVILAVLAALGGGGYLLYKRRKKAAPPEAMDQAPEAPAEPAEQEEEPVQEEAPAADSKYKLKIEFSKIDSPFPDVWGKGEDLEVVYRLANPDGSPISAKLQIFIGKQEAKVKTDTAGYARMLLTFTEKGRYSISAQYTGASEDDTAVASRTIRVVDYREEIVDLYKKMQSWCGEVGIALPQDSTPREVEALIKKSARNISEKSLSQMVGCFEEADYSLHPVTRDNYKNMYLAQKDIREYDKQSERAEPQT